jgi:integrase/recombinase XerD
MRIRPIITYIFVRNRRVSTGYLCADTQGFIYCRITVRGKKQEFATGIALLYGEWDIAAHRMHGKSVAAKQANEALVKLEDRLNDLAADLDRQNRVVTARAIYCLYQNNGATLNLLDLYGTFLAERKTLIGVEISEASYKVSAWRQQVLLAFLSAKKLTDLRPEEFTHNLGDKFIQWGLIEKSYKRSNVNKALQNVVQCLRWGVRRELLDKNPMELYRYKTPARAEIKYLNVEELRALSTQPILTSCLDRVRDCFVFQCWTGLAYADLAVLNVARDAHFHRDKTTNTLRRVLHITRAKSTMQ